jgi:hypothetical protein
MYLSISPFLYLSLYLSFLTHNSLLPFYNFRQVTLTSAATAAAPYHFPMLFTPSS